MKIFKPSDQTHNLEIIPREYVTDAILIIRHELTGIKTEFELTCGQFNGYLTAPFEYEFVEGGSYEITLNDINSKLLYRGKAYATNTTDLENYKLTQ